MLEEKIIYYGLGGGLGHLTRFTAFCHTLGIKPVLVASQKDCLKDLFKTFASEIFIVPNYLTYDKEGLKKWLFDLINRMKPDRMILDAFPAGILGELSECNSCFEDIRIEYIARILKLETYQKRVLGGFPNISKIWKVEKLGKEQEDWFNKLVLSNNLSIEDLNLCYPDFNEDLIINLPDNCWLIVHSGSEEELQELYEYAKDEALQENNHPNIVVVGQVSRPAFLSENIPYYSVYPITNLLKKATRVVSGAGFNIMKQMSKMKAKHIVLPFDRALDDQHLRLKLSRESD